MPCCLSFLIKVFNFYRVEAAFCCAHAALKTLILIYCKRLLNRACRRLCLADAVAHRAALAFFGNYRYLLYPFVAFGRAYCAYGANAGALRAFNALRFVNRIERSVVIFCSDSVKQTGEGACAAAYAKAFINFKCHSLTSRGRREEPYLVPVV